MDYDRAYFDRILALDAAGKSEAGLTPEKFKAEVVRARAYSAVLKTFTNEKAAYLEGKPFTPLADEAAYRTYSNLIVILNMLLAFQKEDYAAVVAAEKRVVMRELKDLGVVRGESVAYQLALQRQYYYLQASANFQLGADAEAIKWTNRLATDAVIQAMKKQLATQTAAEATAAEKLKTKFKEAGAILAVLPFVNVTGNKEDAWMISGALEALTTDLPKLRFTVVERARLKELLGERMAAQMLATDEAQQFGKQLGADFVVMGSLMHQGPKLRADVRFVDVRTGVVAASVTVEAGNDDFMALLRSLTTAIAAHFDQPLSEETIGQLVGSRNTQKEFQAQVRKNDLGPTEAENPTTEPLAVMPFESLGKEPEAEWLSKGLAEVLTADLTRLTSMVIVERSQTAKVLGEASLAQRGITDEKNAAQLGQMLNAHWLLLGSYKQVGGKTLLSIRLVDAKAGKVLDGASTQATEAELFKEARRLTLELVGKLGWISKKDRDEAIAAPAPKTETIRNLVQAPTKEAYAKAVAEDPAYAKVFDAPAAGPKAQLATVAVLPFVNLTGNKDWAWLAAGAADALTNDLPRFRFGVVDRARVNTAIGEQLNSQPKRGWRIAVPAQLELGKQVGANFVVTGSVQRQASKLRAEVGFLDVRTGAITAHLKVEAASDDFMGLLTALTTAIAAQFEPKLSAVQ
jgi:TolB-like protein